jgi:hypothetical protein
MGCGKCLFFKTIKNLLQNFHSTEPLQWNQQRLNSNYAESTIFNAKRLTERKFIPQKFQKDI